MSPDIDARIATLERQIAQQTQELDRLRRSRAPEPVRDYAFTDPGGRAVGLSGLFGGRDRLLLVHNMGAGCHFCTLWADGLVGLLPYLEERTAVVLSSPDPPEVQARIARERGWPFRMASVADPAFLAELGLLDADGGPLPGISAFARSDGGAIVRAAFAEFFPGDAYCAAWHLLGLLPEGVAGWEPGAGERRPAAPSCCASAGTGNLREVAPQTPL